jgi:hypothetical protein
VNAGLWGNWLNNDRTNRKTADMSCHLPGATVGTFSIPWRQFPFPIAAGMLAHAARWALIAFAGANVATGGIRAARAVVKLVSIGPKRSGYRADEHRHERRHGISDHHGQDLRARRMLFERAMPSPA